MVAAALSGASKSDMAQTLNKLDQEGEAYMKHAEKKCRRLKSGQIPFSPEASLWIRQCQVYCSLLWWQNGKLQNYGNLCRTARQCQINAPFNSPSMTVLSVLAAPDITLAFYFWLEKKDNEKWYRFDKKIMSLVYDKKSDEIRCTLRMFLQREDNRRRNLRLVIWSNQSIS